MSETGKNPHVVIVAGEASGDMHAAALIPELRKAVPEVRLSGIGGPAMEAEGVELLYRAEDLALVGFVEVLPKLKVILSTLWGMKRHLRDERPDLLILVDFPDFNFRLGMAAKRLGIKVLYYICPQIWAWRQGRAKTLAHFADRLAAVFPFEEQFLKEYAPDLKAEFVGHPLLDHVPERHEPLPVPENATLVGLLPGSRMSEITRLTPLLMESARIMAQKAEGLHFVLPVAPGLDRRALEPYLTDPPPGLTIIQGRARDVMRESSLLLIASGTATLEAALFRTPMVVVYKTAGLNYTLGKMFIKVSHIAMPNLIAGRTVVPELIQHDASPQAVAAHGLELLYKGPAREDCLAGLKTVRERMGGPGANQRVAAMAGAIIQGS